MQILTFETVIQEELKKKFEKVDECDFHSNPYVSCFYLLFKF